MAETELERLAWDDQDRAAAAYRDCPCESHRLSYLAAVRATLAAVQRAMQLGV